MKKKSTAAILAVILGPYGLHRFYLGQRPLGIMYMFFGCFFTMLTIEEGVPIILLPILLATIDAILFSVMPQEEFDAKYNSHKTSNINSYFNQDKYHERRENQELKQQQRNKRNKGNYDYVSIIKDLQDDLEGDFQQPKTHFHLACCYSMLEKSHEAFFHLEKAIAFGFVDFGAIHNHEDLAYVRSMPKFDKFVLNGYKNVNPLPPPEQNLLSQSTLQNEEAVEEDAEEGLSLLDQIVILGELREKGILTEEEFAAQKHKLLK